MDLPSSCDCTAAVPHNEGNLALHLLHVSDSVIVASDDGQDDDIDWKKLFVTQSETNIHYQQNYGHRGRHAWLLYFRVMQIFQIEESDGGEMLFWVKKKGFIAYFPRN